MIRIARKTAVAVLPKSVYPRESLESGALAVGQGARVFLEEERSSWRVTVEPAAQVSPRGLRALVGAFLNEALSHAVRQRIVALNLSLTTPALARALENGFPNMPHDPLEQLEPQVRADREQDVAQLMEAAKRWL